MNKKLYVGNLPFGCDETSLRAHFEGGGLTVTSVKIMMDRETGRSRGFGFVELSTPEEAQKAAQDFNNQQFMGRPLIVNEAQDRGPRPGGGFGGGPRPGGFSGGSGGGLPRPNGPGGPAPVSGGGFNRGPRPGGFGSPPPADFDAPAERAPARDHTKGKDRDKAKRNRGSDDDWS